MNRGGIILHIKKKISAFTATVLMMTSLFSGVSADESTFDRRIKGDINQDGYVTVSDLVAFSHCMNGTAFWDESDLYYADMNKDNVVNVFDLMLLRKTVLGERELEYDEESTQPTTEPTEAPTSYETQPPVTTTLPETTTVTSPVTTEVTTTVTTTITTTVTTAKLLSLDDMPTEYASPLNWVWTNRISAEKSTDRWNTIFDQIYGGNGTINYVVRWQSYKTVTLAQRQQFEVMIEDSINNWAEYLVGYDGWKYDHIDVNVVGWAVIDESVILDKQPDEIIYTNCTPYDSQWDTSNGREVIPTLLPNAPDELSRMYHFDTNIGYNYPGGLDKRFDMYLWATQGFPDIGGCGGDWGQRLSDDAYLKMLNGTNIHVFEHELGHGFGITDFYGGEGASDGFPPGGFPEPTIMMAGNSVEITNYDGWQLRYIWSKIKDQKNNKGVSRFN